jgi:hypothetical protein
MDGKDLSAALGVIVAGMAVIGTGWAALDYLEIRPVFSRELKMAERQFSRELRATETQVAANTSAVQLIRWQLLDQRRRTQGLSPNEQVEYCKLSRLLGLRGAGCQ